MTSLFIFIFTAIFFLPSALSAKILTVCQEMQDQEPDRLLEDLKWMKLFERVVLVAESLNDANPYVMSDIRAVLNGATNVSEKYSGSPMQHLFEDLQLLMMAMERQTSIINAPRITEGRIHAESTLESKPADAHLLLRFLKIKGLQFKEKIFPDRKVYVIEGNSNGSLIEKFIADIETKTGFSVAIPANLRALGSVVMGYGIVNFGIQALLIPNPTDSPVLQHELVHLELMTSERYNVFNAFLFSEAQKIPVKGYEDTFHLTELPATVAAAESSLANVIRMQKAMRPPTDISAAAHETMLHLWNLNSVLEVTGITLVRVGMLEKAIIADQIRVEDNGFKIEFKENASNLGPGFTSGAIDVSTASKEFPNGYISFADKNMELKIPLSRIQRDYFIGLRKSDASRKLASAIAKIVRFIRQSAQSMFSGAENGLSYNEIAEKIRTVHGILLQLYKTQTPSSHADREVLEKELLNFRTLKKLFTAIQDWPGPT